MKKISNITRISLMLAILFTIDKGLGIIRQLIIGRQFGLSAELDVFNAANNLPDMLFALISGGALAIAFIPVLSSVLTQEGKKEAWKLFSQVTNLAFLITAGLSIVVALIAKPLVSSQIGIAPGFTEQQQALSVSLMRLNLIATLIFSISGLVMGALQANQHFLLPALAPILYDLGQIFGAVILAPEKGLSIGSIQLPGFGLGVYGLVYGVIIGALLHLLIQVPGLIKYKFHWTIKIDLKDHRVVRVLKLMGPRMISMLAIQLIFLAQDNLASRLQVGAVSALTYGWWIMQVPETIIGTTIATALLPTLSEFAAKQDWSAFKARIENAVQVLIAIALPIAGILAFTLFPLIKIAFGFDASDSMKVLFTTQAYLAGLLGHVLVEIGVRSFYAKQNARIPLIGSLLTFVLFVIFSLIFVPILDAPGIALANSIAYSIQALVLLIILSKSMKEKLILKESIIRAVISLLCSGLLSWLIMNYLPFGNSGILTAFLSLLIGSLPMLFILKKELLQLLKL